MVIINSVLTLQVSTAKPMTADLVELRLRSSTLDSLHTGVSPGSIGCAYTYSGPFREARISVQPLWGFSSSNPDHSQSRAEHTQKHRRLQNLWRMAKTWRIQNLWRMVKTWCIQNLWRIVKTSRLEKYWHLQKCWCIGKTRRSPMLAQQ
jgi:hypothetical protein